MGRVIKPERATNIRRIIDEALKDLDPSLREQYRELLNSLDSMGASEKIYEQVLENIRLKRKPPKLGLER